MSNKCSNLCHDARCKHSGQSGEMMNAEQRKQKFLESVAMIPEAGCWIWLKAVNHSGYGIVGYLGASKLAHRVSWMLFRGNIPDGLGVLHRCDVPPCVNPHHLFLGSRSSNSQDAANKGRLHCQKRPDLWARHCKTKLTDDDIRGIRHWLSCGVERKRIAAHFGVNPSTINQIGRGDIWSSVK